jgi:hypothetical protein
MGTGMRKVSSDAGARFSPETAQELRDLIDEFDAVRTRGEVESRSVYLVGHRPR